MAFTPKGIITAMLTPLHDDFTINEEALRQLIDYVIDGGVHGIFISGTAGEFYALSHEQKRKLFMIANDQAAGRVPIYAGTNGITTQETLALTKIAEECKVDAVSILTPMFISPTQKELVYHYKSIADSTSLPILLYNNPPKTGINLTTETVMELAAVENIIGIKDSSGDFTLTTEYIRNTRTMDFHVLAGRDTLIHATLCHGGTGAIAACSNIAPRLMADIYDKFIAGDLAGSLEAQFCSAPIRLAFSLGSYPTVLKESLELIGIQAGPSFGPIGRMSPEEKQEIKELLKELKIL